MGASLARPRNEDARLQSLTTVISILQVRESIAAMRKKDFRAWVVPSEMAWWKGETGRLRHATFCPKSAATPGLSVLPHPRPLALTPSSCKYRDRGDDHQIGFRPSKTRIIDWPTASYTKRTVANVTLGKQVEHGRHELSC